MRISNKLKSAALSLSLVGGSMLLAGSPAQAAAANCNDDIATLADLIAATSCTYRGVTLTYTSHTGFQTSDALSFQASPSPSANAFSFFLQGTNMTNPFTGTLLFSITAPSGKYMVDYTSALTSSANGGNNNGTFDLAGSAGTAAATYVPTNLAQGATKTYSNTTTLSDAFTSTVGVTNGTIQQFTQSFNFATTPPPATGTPSPLPILGAGAAFGFSRKLRKRIAAA